MSLEGGRLNQNPENRFATNQMRQRAETNTLEELAKGYSKEAVEVFAGKNKDIAHDEAQRFAKEILSKKGPEQYEELNKLSRALLLRKPAIFDRIPDDEHERAAFALALVNEHNKSVQ